MNNKTLLEKEEEESRGKRKEGRGNSFLVVEKGR